MVIELPAIPPAGLTHTICSGDAATVRAMVVVSTSVPEVPVMVML
jgi:hypothetical protein